MDGPLAQRSLRHPFARQKRRAPCDCSEGGATAVRAMRAHNLSPLAAVGPYSQDPPALPDLSQAGAAQQLFEYGLLRRGSLDGSPKDLRLDRLGYDHDTIIVGQHQVARSHEDGATADRLTHAHDLHPGTEVERPGRGGEEVIPEATDLGHIPNGAIADSAHSTMPPG